MRIERRFPKEARLNIGKFKSLGKSGVFTNFLVNFGLLTMPPKLTRSLTGVSDTSENQIDVGGRAGCSARSWSLTKL